MKAIAIDRGGSSDGPRRALRHVLWAAAAVATVAYGLRFCADGGDFLAFYHVGMEALRRGDIYSPRPDNGMYVFYAPHFSLLMAPFAALPRFASGFLWFALKVAALVWTVREAWAELRATAYGQPRPTLWPFYLALPFVIAINAIVGEMKLGQVNLLVFFLTLVAARSAEARRPWRAALFFSVALLKVTPWVFIPWFGLRRQWKLLGALVAVGVGWVAALAAWFGPGAVVGIFRSWYETSTTHKLGLDSIAYFENQSLQGVAARLARAFPVLAEPFHGIAPYRVLWIPAAIVLFAILAVVVRRDRFRPTLPRAEFAFVCLVMFLCSPDSRWAHQMQLLAPLTMLSAMAIRVQLFAFRRRGAVPAGLRPWRRAVAAVVALGLLFQVVLTRDIVGKPLDNASRLWSTHFLFVVALTALVAAALLGRGEASVVATAAASPSDPFGLRAALPLPGIGAALDGAGPGEGASAAAADVQRPG